MLRMVFPSLWLPLLTLCGILHLLTVNSQLTAETVSPTVPLTPAERQWLQAHPTITLAPDADFRPIEYFNEEGVYLGAAAPLISSTFSSRSSALSSPSFS